MKLLPLALFLVSLCCVHAADVFHPTGCEGAYPHHLQGICTDGKENIYWCWTDKLVKTDRDGSVLKAISVANHHGDLCYRDGRVYVAVNLGKFNQPAGEADSWVYVYDGDTLAPLAKYPVPEVVHGAGGIEFHDGKFIIVGGLPPGAGENYLYEYNQGFKFQNRRVLASGYTLMGIQTVAYADGAWWFGCYGNPAVLVRADEKFQVTGKWEFNASVGIAPTRDGRFLIAQNKIITGDEGKTKANQACVVIARPEEKSGMEIEKPCSH